MPAAADRNREIGAVVIGAVLLLVAALNVAQAHPDGVAIGIEGVVGLSLIAGGALTARHRG